MFYLTTHSTHFIYGYMASDIWLRTIMIVRKETRCRHIGYSYRLTARVLLYAPSHRHCIVEGHSYKSIKLRYVHLKVQAHYPGHASWMFVLYFQDNSLAIRSQGRQKTGLLSGTTQKSHLQRQHSSLLQALHNPWCNNIDNNVCYLC